MKIENVADLRVLVETARTGSLTAASRELGVTPAAASAMLKRLEAVLGARLFERSTRAIRLTVEGQMLLEYATRALELLEEGEAQLVDTGARLVGTLRVSVPSDLTRSVLLPWFDEFLALHPGVQLALSVSDRLADVMRDAVDLALRYGDLLDSRLVARPLASTRRVLCASPAYIARRGAPQAPEDLAQHNCPNGPSQITYIDELCRKRWRSARRCVFILRSKTQVITNSTNFNPHEKKYFLSRPRTSSYWMLGRTLWLCIDVDY